MVNKLTFSLLRKANVIRCCNTKKYKGNENWTPAQWLQALIGELGEYANLMKKVDRGDLTLESARCRLSYELADTQIYLDLLACCLEINLGDAVIEKFNIVSDRVGSTIKIGENNNIIHSLDSTHKNE